MDAAASGRRIHNYPRGVGHPRNYYKSTNPTINPTNQPTSKPSPTMYNSIYPVGNYGNYWQPHINDKHGRVSKVPPPKLVLTNKSSTPARYCQPPTQIISWSDAQYHQKISSAIHGNGQGAHGENTAGWAINKDPAAGYPWCATSRWRHEPAGANMHGCRGLDVLFCNPRGYKQRKISHQPVWLIPCTVIQWYSIHFCCIYFKINSISMRPMKSRVDGHMVEVFKNVYDC